MTDQKTLKDPLQGSLRKKAKTTSQIYAIQKTSGLQEKWVLLSDAEAALSELKTGNDFLNQENQTLSQRLFDTQTDVVKTDKEIQQLKEELKKEKHDVDVLEMQIETAKTNLLAFLDGLGYYKKGRQKVIDCIFSEGFSDEKVLWVGKQ